MGSMIAVATDEKKKKKIHGFLKENQYNNLHHLECRFKKLT